MTGRRLRGLVALAVALLTGVAVGFLLGRGAGAVVGAAFAVPVVLLADRARLQVEPPPPAPAGDREDPLAGLAGYDTYRRVLANLTWAGHSARHFDHAVRPMLQHAVAAVLDERYGVDLWHDRDRAGALVGADLWPLVDPARPASDDSTAPGAGVDAVARLLDRMEQL